MRKAKPVMMIDGRALTETARILAVRRGLKKRQARLERSLAEFQKAGRDARRSEVERWARMRADVAEFERVLAALLAGEEVAPWVKTGKRTRELPDVIG